MSHCLRAALLSALCGAALLGAAPAAARGQLVRGSVIDRETQRPVVAVSLAVQRDGKNVAAATTDDAGRFILRLPRPADYVIAVSHIGYRSRLTDLPAAGSAEEITIVIEVSAAALELEPIRVIGRRPAGARLLDGFYARAAARRPRNDGRFLIREDMERMAVSQATDYLALVPSLQLRQMPAGRERMPLFHRQGQLCVPAVYLNGALIAAHDIDTFVIPGSLEGIEIYTQGDEPQEFWDRNGCGVILLWTPLRSRGDPMDRRRVLTLTGLVVVSSLIMALTF
jgi:hypothetical protein